MRLPWFGIALLALAGLPVVLVGTGGVRGGTPAARADTTDVVVIGCEFIAGAIDGDLTNPITDADVAAACGGNGPGGAPTALAPSAGQGGGRNLYNLAGAIGNKDHILQASDFRGGGPVDESLDANQLSTDCTHAGATANDFAYGLACTLDVFVFVNRESAVVLSLPTGLKAIEGGGLNLVCSKDGAQPQPHAVSSVDINGVYSTVLAHGLYPGDVVVSGGQFSGSQQFTVAAVPSATTFTLAQGALAIFNDTTVARMYGLTTDNDCNAGIPASDGVNGNGDGVVMFHILEDNASRGSVKTVTVSQDAVPQFFDVNVVGTRSNVRLTLAENLIETNASVANVTACQTATSYTTGIAPPTSTVASAVVTDADNIALTRVPVSFSITPPAATSIATLGLGNATAGIVANTQFTIRTANIGFPSAAYDVVCGGIGTGTATVDAAINLVSCSLTTCIPLSSTYHDTKVITTGGVPSAIVLTAVPAMIVCNSSNTSTVTAHVTDSLGQNVADGVPVNFSVVALGAANPINTVTKDGLASSIITPYSSAGATVVVTAGDSGIAAPVQTSIRVECAAPTPSPTPTPMPCPGDGDCDGVPDALDNCPFAPNPDQANTNLFNYLLNRPGSDQRGDVCDPDISGDGYGNARKLALHKNLLIYCPIMRADVDGDGAVSILDFIRVAKWFTKSIPVAPQRYAQDADNVISIFDLTIMAQVFTRNVTACP